MKQGGIAKAFSLEAKLKRNIRRHFTKLGFAKAGDGTLILPGVDITSAWSKEAR